MNPFALTPEDHREIARLVIDGLRNAPSTSPDILTLAEAKIYTRRPSKTAFFEWCQRWKVKPHSRGRYGRAQLDLALQRESGAAHLPATLRKHQGALEAHAA